MTSENLNALPCSHVPEPTGSINAAGQTVVTSKIELAARKFSSVAFKRKQALPCAYIPNLSSVIERGC